MLDIEWIEAIARAVSGTAVEQLTVVSGDNQLHLSRIPTAPAPAGTPLEPEGAGDEVASADAVVVARRVGVYHRPQRPVHSGDRIEAGEIVGFIESLRILNEVISDHSGVVTQVLVEDGSPVEFGQELIALRESPNEPSAASVSHE